MLYSTIESGAILWRAGCVPTVNALPDFISSHYYVEITCQRNSVTTSKRHAAREMMPAYPEKGNFGSIIDPFLSGLFRLGAGMSQVKVHLDLIRIAE